MLQDSINSAVIEPLFSSPAMYVTSCHARSRRSEILHTTFHVMYYAAGLSFRKWLPRKRTEMYMDTIHSKTTRQHYIHNLNSTLKRGFTAAHPQVCINVLPPLRHGISYRQFTQRLTTLVFTVNIPPSNVTVGLFAPHKYHTTVTNFHTYSLLQA